MSCVFNDVLGVVCSWRAPHSLCTRIGMLLKAAGFGMTSQVVPQRVFVSAEISSLHSGTWEK